MPPYPQDLRGTLLNIAYENIHHDVDRILTLEHRVNVIFGESGDRAGHRCPHQ
jgi:hypothetical protein